MQDLKRKLKEIIGIHAVATKINFGMERNAKPPISKGCSRFFFDNNGNVCHEEDSVVWFDALTRDRAQKKMDNFIIKLKTSLANI